MQGPGDEASTATRAGGGDSALHTLDAPPLEETRESVTCARDTNNLHAGRVWKEACSLSRLGPQMRILDGLTIRSAQGTTQPL